MTWAAAHGQFDAVDCGVRSCTPTYGADTLSISFD